uniref:Uncharacterized protein n=1 Tax=Theileria annulata TaxID=5874 RepID=A0A3B0MRM3_THEAN
MVETILGLMRNYIYKQTNYYHYFWLDRLSVSMSKYLFNYRDHLIKLSLKSSKTLYRLNYNYHNPEDSEGSNYKNTNKYSDHVDIVNNYVLSNFNNSFYKLWSYLNCNYKLYSLYSNNCNINPYFNNSSPSINNALDSDNTPESDSGYFDETDDYNHLYNLLDDYQIINYDNLLIPMILPLKLIFFNLHYYSSHQIYLNNLEETANKDDVDILKKIVDNIRKIRFISLHNAKGRTLSTFYTMSNITMNEHLNHLSLQLLLEPVKSDLYLLTELNTNLCPYQLNKNITTNVLNLLIRYNNLNKQRKLDNKDSDNNWVILLRLIRYLSSYSKSYVEEAFNIRQDHFELSEKLQMLLKIKDSNNSGGIQPHPILPIYAIAHGSSNDKSQPSYSVSLQHTSTLAKEFMFTKNEILLNNLINIYNVSTLQLTTFHSSNLFGDLLSIYWSGDSLCLYDKFGWIMIYYMKNLLYLNNVPSKNGKSEKDHVPNSIPTICFKTHLTSNYMSWLGEYYVLTLGNGILEESIERDIIFINLTLLNSQKESNSQEQESNLQENEPILEKQTNLQEESKFQEPKESNFQEQHDTNSFDTTSTDFNVSNTEPNPENSDVEGLDNSELKSVGRDVISSKGLKMFSENNVPCICIWNLVEYSNNNIPKIKILMSFVHPDNKETKEKDELPKVTSILPIKNDTVTNGSKEVQLEYDLLLFDSMGVLRVFSVTDMDIVFTHALENTAIIAAFMLLNGNIVTVTEDSKIKVYKLMSLYTKPQLIFDTVSIVKQPRSVVSSSSFVSSIGEFISQKFSREKPQQPQQPLKVINVKLYSRQFIAIVYSDEQVSTTQLPNFAVY